MFCEETDKKQLHQCYTFELDLKIRQLCENSEKYSHVKAKLSEGDMIATEAKYHLVCLSNFYKCTQQSQTAEEVCSDIAFDEVFKRISDWIKNDQAITGEENFLYFKDLFSLYDNVLKEVNEDGLSINRTRLKHKILDKFPDIDCSKKGKEIVFYKTAAAENLVKTALPSHADSDRKMDEVVEIIRNILSDENTTELQKDSVPEKLVNFFTKILLGSLHHSQAAVTIAQLTKIQFCGTLSSG